MATHSVFAWRSGTSSPEWVTIVRIWRRWFHGLEKRLPLATTTAAIKKIKFRKKKSTSGVAISTQGYFIRMKPVP